ncbi:MAG: ribosome recycling factor [bacterium]
MIDEIYMEAEKRMKDAVGAVEREFMALRTGRASAALLDGVKVECYGSLLPINQVATISVPEARLIVIQPWDKQIAGDIERAILKSNLGITPNNDGNFIRLAIPEITEERRRELAKIVKKRAEEGRISVRSARREANDLLKSLQRDGDISEDDMHRAMDRIQKLTDKYTEEIDELLSRKEKEIMTVG